MAKRLAPALVWMVCFAVCGFAVGARADVGIVPVGGDMPASQRSSMEASLLRAKHAVPLKAACDVDKIDARCFDAMIVNHNDVDEVAVATLKRGPDATTHLVLRVYAVNEWAKPILELSTDAATGAAGDAAAGLVQQAFDPGGYVGSAHVDGVSHDEDLFIDGLHSDSVDLKLSVGDHTLEVVRAGAPPVKMQFHVDYRGKALVEVPPLALGATQPAEWPGYVADGAAIVGAATLVAGLTTEIFDVHLHPVLQTSKKVTTLTWLDNIDQWRTHARDTVGFLPCEADPLATSNPAGACVDGWDASDEVHGKPAEAHYGPPPARGSSEAAQFAMTAISRENELGWHATEYAAVALIAAGAVMTAGGGFAAYALWPSE